MSHVHASSLIINVRQRPSRPVLVIMNDLAGLDWNSAASAPNPQRTQSHSQAQYSAFKAPSLPSIPRQSTPLSAQTSGATPKLNPRSNGSFKAQGHDSFASLLGPSVSKTPSSSVTLQERQKQLLAEKAKQPLGQAVASNVPYHATDAHFWEGLGSGRGTPVRTKLGFSRCPGYMLIPIEDHTRLILQDRRR